MPPGRLAGWDEGPSARRLLGRERLRCAHRRQPDGALQVRVEGMRRASLEVVEVGNRPRLDGLAHRVGAAGRRAVAAAEGRGREGGGGQLGR